MGNALFPNIDVGPESLTREELLAILKDYKRAEEALHLDEARLEALLKLNDMTAASEEDIIVYSLEEAIRLTGSKIGWTGSLSPDESTLNMHCWSRGTMEECGIIDRPHTLNVGDGGIWIEPIVQRKPVIINDYDSHAHKAIPGGHVPVKRFMGVPIYDGEHIVAVAEVGNKETDYDSPDLRQLSLLMSGVWRIILRKRAEEALSESRSHAELYVDFMGHDINNMNQVAMGFLELALEKLSSEGKVGQEDRVLLEKPMESMKNSAKLIDNVKKLQRLNAGLLEPSIVDVGRVLAEVKTEAEREAGVHITINYEPTAVYDVKANELLKDVFSNIVENSIKHSRQRAPLSITMGIMPTDNGYYYIAIEDDGPGIPDVRKAEIFDRLSPGKIKALRTGLGLGLVKTLVESYKGHIRVEDRVKGDYTQGCRFVIVLPDARNDL